ncbi:MAG: zinc metalloprotease HtpX [Myxococcota bacterium]|nr:zinc metalloprotease HtpX [Myxococcota bacterium]
MPTTFNNKDTSDMNTAKTFLLMSALAVFLVFIGGVLGGPNGARGCFFLALLMNGTAYWFSDKMVLRAYRARIVTDTDAPRLTGSVRKLAHNAGLPMPRVAIIPMEAPNAFATGRNPRNAVVAVSTGLLNLMTQDELEGVLAHELGHIRNRDLLISTMAAALAGAVSMLSNSARWGVVSRGTRARGTHPAALLLITLLAPMAAMLIQVAISRNREFDADKAGAQISGKPLALSSALEKIQSLTEAQPVPIDPSTAHLFIMNPLGQTGGLAALFRTHPSTQERIDRLREMAGRI